MNLSWVHIHLLLNHFPIVGAIFGLLLLSYAFIKRSEDLKWASYWVFVIVALIAIPTYISGTQAEETVEKLPGVTDVLIHKHQAIANQAAIALGILGAMGLAGLFLFRGDRKPQRWFPTSVLVVAIVATGLVCWTGLQGGIIRHTEVRADTPALLPTGTEPKEQGHIGGKQEKSKKPERSNKKSKESEHSDK